MVEKRVLIISVNSFSKILNNGKTLESLFSNFKKENLSQLFFYNEIPDFDYCNNYYRVTDIDVLKKILGKSQICGNVINKSDDHTFSTKNKFSSIFNFFRNLSSYLNLFRDLLWKTNVWKTADLNTWLNKIKPDIIFFVGGYAGFTHEIASYVSGLLNIPLVTYFTDDYIIYPKIKNFIDFLQRRRMKRIYRKTINDSLLLFSIGEIMSKTYSEYFDKEFFPIMNSTVINKYTDYIESKVITISYFGGLHLNRWKMIVRLADIIGDRAIIKIYTTNLPSKKIFKIFKKYSVNYCGSLPPEKLYNKMITSDILLHVESDNKYYRSLTRLSVSTKIPEYLASGRCILAFGPAEVASMRILKENNIGVVLCSSNENFKLKQYIEKLLVNYPLRKTYGVTGYNYAVKNFDITKNATDFSNRIQQI